MVDGHRTWRVDPGETPTGDPFTLVRCECGYKRTISSMDFAMAAANGFPDPVLDLQDRHLDEVAT